MTLNRTIAAVCDAIDLAKEIDTPDPRLTDALRSLCMARAARLVSDAQRDERRRAA